MLTFVQVGARLPYTNNSGSIIASGAVVVINSGGGIGAMNVGIAVDTIAVAGTGILEIVDVQSLPKTAGEASVFGQNLYWNAGTSAVTIASSGNTWIGNNAQTNGSGSGDTTVNVLINGLATRG